LGTETPAHSAQLRLVGESRTSPRENKQGKICYADVFRLTDLPEVMEKMGWKNSATLMKKWFDSPGYTMTREQKEGLVGASQYPSHLLETSLITMEWALSFPRIKREYDGMFGSRNLYKSIPPIYENPKAKKLLIKRLFRANKFTESPQSFGDLTKSALALDEEWQFQRHSVDDNREYLNAWWKDSTTADPDLDDMWGALARFTFKIAGEGTVTPKKKVVKSGGQSSVLVEHYEINVSRIGVYIRDTYDFNGNQYLGHWSKHSAPHVRVYPLSYFAGGRGEKGICPDDFVSVTNERFNSHRKMTGFGGDLIVLSDVLATTLKRPFRFRVTPQDITNIS
tara:strand:- start:1713 stop:2726 length:1014 start_codon:yes stop_codon:yes gene_type:complete